MTRRLWYAAALGAVVLFFGGVAILGLDGRSGAPPLPTAPEAAAQVVEPGEPSQTSPMLECYLAADEAAIDDWRALELCQNARSIGPVSCYEAAQDETALSDNQVVRLCQCAAGTQPVACWEQAQDETMLSDQQILGLCNAIDARGLRSDCLPREDTL